MPRFARARVAAAWVVAIALVAVTSATFIAGLPLWIRFWTANPPLATAMRAAGLPYSAVAVVLVALGLAALAVHAATSVLIVWRRRDSFAVITSVAIFVYGCVFVGVLSVLRANDPVWAEPARVIATVNRVGVTLILLTFPNGRFVPDWTRWVFRTVAAWALLAIAFPQVGPLHRWDYAVAESVTLATVGVGAQVYRFRRIATAEERQQLKWCTFGILFTLGSWAILGPALVVAAPEPSALYLLPPGAQLGTATYVFLTLAAATYYMANTVPPVAIAMAILRRGLFDIDLVANRTLTYGAATVLVGLGAVALGLAAQQAIVLMTGRASEFTSLATGLVAVAAVVPVRRRIQPLVDRLLPERPTVTVLFSDVVGSTELAVRLGDRAWGDVLARYHALVARELRRHGGQEVDTAGDGVFAIFGRAEPAIRCARAMADAVRSADIRTRVGIHSGPCEMRAGKVVGTTVHVAARLVTLARPGGILISDATRSSVVEGTLEVQDEGDRELKGLPGLWRVFSVVQ